MGHGKDMSHIYCAEDRDFGTNQGLGRGSEAEAVLGEKYGPRAWKKQQNKNIFLGWPKIEKKSGGNFNDKKNSLKAQLRCRMLRFEEGEYHGGGPK